MGSEASGDLSEDHGWSEGALATIVGVGDVAPGDEDEEIITAFADATSEFLTGDGVGGFAQQPGEAAVEIGAVLGKGAVLEGFAPSSDGNGAQQQ